MFLFLWLSGKGYNTGNGKWHTRVWRWIEIGKVAFQKLSTTARKQEYFNLTTGLKASRLYVFPPLYICIYYCKNILFGLPLSLSLSLSLSPLSLLAQLEREKHGLIINCKMTKYILVNKRESTCSNSTQVHFILLHVNTLCKGVNLSLFPLAMGK